MEIAMLAFWLIFSSLWDFLSFFLNKAIFLSSLQKQISLALLSSCPWKLLACVMSVVLMQTRMQAFPLALAGESVRLPVATRLPFAFASFLLLVCFIMMVTSSSPDLGVRLLYNSGMGLQCMHVGLKLCYGTWAVYGDCSAVLKTSIDITALKLDMCLVLQFHHLSGFVRRAIECNGWSAELETGGNLGAAPHQPWNSPDIHGHSWNLEP